MRIIPIFAIPTIKTNINRDFTEDELQLFLSGISMKKHGQKGLINSAGGLFNNQSTDYYLFDSYVEELKELKIYCQYQLKQYLEDIEGVDTDIANLRITQSWLNRTRPKESHHLHHHPNSYLSGVLYIKCLPNDSIIFSNRLQGLYNSNMDFPKRKKTIWNLKTEKVSVKEGDLLLFPSWTIHSVDLNKTKDQERISLSFNTFPKGRMGQLSEATQVIL